MTMLKLTVGAVLGSLLAFSAGAEQATEPAADFPSKPIRIVVPYPPGGIGDAIPREVGVQLSNRLGQTVIIDNKPGASQMLGADFVAKAKPDGYTLFLGSLSSLILNLGSQKNITYDSFKDFAPVSLAFSTPLYLVVNPELPFQTVAGLIEYAKQNPGKLSFGSIGNGSSLHLTGEMFKSMSGADITHVPYKGSMPALIDLVGGRIDMMFDAGTSALPMVKDGRLRVLGVTSKTPASGTPDIKPIADDVPGFDASFWFGFVAPAGTPKPIVDKLSKEIQQILADPEMRKRFSASGVELLGSTPEAMAARMKADYPIWQEIQKKAGIQPQ